VDLALPTAPADGAASPPEWNPPGSRGRDWPQKSRLPAKPGLRLAEAATR